MNVAKVSMVAVLVQALAGFAQDSASATEAPKPSTQEAAVMAAPRPETGTASISAEALPDSYKIGSADVLTITVWKELTLTGSYLVRPDGMISMPLLGDVEASSLTPQQLAGELEEKLKKYIQSPNVTVQISQIHSKVVYLLGEVAKKGPIDMSPGMTLLQAIASAGGLTDYANAKKIYVLRNDAGKQVKIPAHYKEALKGESSASLLLRPGDTIVVP
jgi:polysaccharide export outer membrane protein